jgi:hypothetical protein
MATRDLHKVELNIPAKNAVIMATDMRPGQYAKVVSERGQNEGRIIGRLWTSESYSNSDDQKFFALDNPASTWTTPTFEVRVLKPGELINMTIGELA